MNFLFSKESNLDSVGGSALSATGSNLDAGRSRSEMGSKLDTDLSSSNMGSNMGSSTGKLIRIAGSLAND